MSSDEGVVEKYSKPLSRAAWDLFDQRKKDFNNTKEYSVIDRSNANGVSKKQLYYDYRNNAERCKKISHMGKRKSSIAIGTRTIAYGDGSTAMVLWLLQVEITQQLLGLDKFNFWRFIQYLLVMRHMFMQVNLLVSGIMYRLYLKVPLYMV